MFRANNSQRRCFALKNHQIGDFSYFPVGEAGFKKSLFSGLFSGIGEISFWPGQVWGFARLFQVFENGKKVSP